MDARMSDIDRFSKGDADRGEVGETASKSIWMFLAIAAIAFALFEWINRGEDWRQVIGHFASAGLEALTLACLLGAISEAGIFRNYFERRLQRTIEASDERLRKEYESILKNEFLTRARDPGYLRQFERSALENVRRAVHRSFFESELPDEVFEFLETVDKFRGPLDVWRTDYKLVLGYKSHPTNPSVYELEIDRRFSYRNYTGAAREIDQKTEEYTESIPSISNETLFVVEKIKYGSADLLAGNIQTCEPAGEGVIHRHRSRIVIEPSERNVPAPVHAQTSRGWYSKTRPWVMTFFRPVHGFSVTLRHSSAIVPRLYVFGSGGSTDVTDPLPPTFSGAECTIWDYDGWCMENQGAVLIFPQKQAD
jgi:hypothetical protein